MYLYIAMNEVENFIEFLVVGNIGEIFVKMKLMNSVFPVVGMLT